MFLPFKVEIVLKLVAKSPLAATIMLKKSAKIIKETLITLWAMAVSEEISQLMNYIFSQMSDLLRSLYRAIEFLVL